MPHANASDFNPIKVKQPNHREINDLNRKFWEEQSRLAGMPTAKADSFEETARDLESEPSWHPPLKFRDVQSTVPSHQNGRAYSNPTAEYLTPEQYLETHYVTRELARLGVTHEQRQAMRFRGTNKGWPFAQWSFTWLESTPGQAIPLVKAYCALKWLILENPSYSRGKDDAWRLVSDVMAAPTFAIGARARNAQSKRARKLRGKLNDEGKTIGEVVSKLALKQYPTERAKGLWPHLKAVLEKEGLSPEEVVDPRNLQECAYVYDFHDGRKKITFRRFEGIVSQARTGKKKSC